MRYSIIIDSGMASVSLFILFGFVAGEREKKIREKKDEKKK